MFLVVVHVEKVFRWFDRITWDRVFTSAKLHTFLQVLDSPKLKGYQNLAIKPGDTKVRYMLKQAKAAQFTNDAFGGQNWEQLANRIQTSWLKILAQTTLLQDLEDICNCYCLLQTGQYLI